MFTLLKRKWIATTLAAALVLGGGTAALAASTTDDLFDRLRNVYNLVEIMHKDGADAQKFFDGAVKGGLEALGDPYTSYFSPKEYGAFMESLNGSFSGIGAYLEQGETHVIISAPIKGTPAAAAGLKSGDRILEVNGTSLAGATTEKAISLIRGVAGTEVTLKVERPSEGRTFTVKITRAVINVPEVESKMLDAQVGYIQIASFGERSAADFYTAVNEIKAQGAKGLVLDLRQNPGGYVDAAVQIASAFVPADQPVVWQVTKGQKEAYPSSGQLINLPVTVLVDQGSASASEILSGAIQDYGVGPLVGVKTFGKGTVQNILPQAGGAGLKVTIAEYLTPKERHVHGIGLTPDYVVDLKAAAEKATPLALTHPLSLASFGDDVKGLQERLAYLGYDPELDGFFGRKTALAVMAFARANYLDPEAPVDLKFIQALNHRTRAQAENAKEHDIQLDKALELVRDKLKH